MTDPDGGSMRHVYGLHHALFAGITAAGMQSAFAIVLDVPPYSTWIAALSIVPLLMRRVNTYGSLADEAPVLVAAARVAGE